MSEKLRIFFAGSGRIAVPVLKALCAAPEIELAGAGTQPDRPVGRKRLLTPTPLGEAAAAMGIPLYKFPDINAPESLEILRNSRMQMLVVLSYGQLLKKAVLEMPPLGCINIHGSLLPRWRGASPVQQVILHQEPVTGVGFMRMERGLDTGAVYRSYSIPVKPDITADELEMELGELAALHAAETLVQIASGALQSHPQQEEGMTLCRKITKEEGEIDWKMPAEKIEAMSRAFFLWPGAYCTVFAGGSESVLTVNRAKVRKELSGTPGTVIEMSKRSLIVACGEGALELLNVTPAGRKPMEIGAYINGLRGIAPEFKENTKKQKASSTTI